MVGGLSFRDLPGLDPFIPVLVVGDPGSHSPEVRAQPRGSTNIVCIAGKIHHE